MRNAGTRFHDSPPSVQTPWRAMGALFFGASLLLVSAVSGCAAGYQQPYATTTMIAPNVQASVEAPGVEFTASAPAPTVEARIAPAQVVVQPTVVAPELITITPDVQVVAAYEEPVFFTGGFYYREINGGWYRSHSHSGGWSSYNDAPYSVRSIENRHSYRDYRPAGWRSSRPSYAGNNDYNRGYDRGYQRPSQNYQPRPSYNNSGYQRPQQSYNQGYQRPAYQPRPSYNNNNAGYNRPAQNYQPRPSYNNNAGYNRPTQNYQPRPSYNQGSQNYQPRPSYNQGTQNYQPRPSYTGGNSGSSYKPRSQSTPTKSYSSRSGSSARRR